MKFFSIVGAFTLALLLSILLTILITPAETQSLTDLIAIAREEGWIHGGNRASVIWEEYQARRHAVKHLDVKQLLRFLIVFGICLVICWRVVKSRNQTNLKYFTSVI